MINLKFALIAAMFFGYAASIALTKNTTSVQSCRAVLKSFGASEHFGISVGHAIHALTVQDLQKFKPDVTEKNKVPTVNKDMNSDQPILPFAPDQKIGNDFKYEGMQLLDRVLSDSKEGIPGWTNLENVVHAIHMQEYWTQALIEYKTVKENPPSAKVCACAGDVEHNGVLDVMRYSALAMREPKLLFGNKLDEKNPNHGSILWYYFPLSEAFWNKHAEETPGKILQSSSSFLPHLKTQDDWQVWKQVMAPGHAENVDLALFLFCALEN